MIERKDKFIRIRVIGGSGIFDSIVNILKKPIVSQLLTSAGKSVASVLGERLVNRMMPSSNELARTAAPQHQVELSQPQQQVALSQPQQAPPDKLPLTGSPRLVHPVFINLLLYNDHYCLINNFNRLVSSQLTNHNGARLFCCRCLCSFSCQSALDKHEYYCKHHTPRRVTIPGDVVKFKNYNHSMRVPFAIYADFESYIKPITTCEPCDNKSYTTPGPYGHGSVATTGGIACVAKSR